MSASTGPSPANSSVKSDAQQETRAPQLLQLLIDSVPDYLFVKDSHGRFVVANRVVAQDLGLTAADLIGKTDFDIHPRNIAQKFVDDDQRVIAAGEPSLDLEEYVLTASGERKWLSTSKLPLRDAANRVVGIVAVCRDITARKAAEVAHAESESRWQFALEGAGQGVWDHDLRSKKAYFSPMWRKMRGIGIEEWVDPSREAWLARLHPDDRQRIADEADRQNSGELKQNSFEYRERHRNGKWMWILSRGRPVEWLADGSVARIIGTDTDITDLKEAETQAAEDKAETYRRHLTALEKAQEATEAAHKLAQSMARHDPLTGLPNRRVFEETLNAALARVERGSARCAVMIIDLNRFKPVNDLYGHAVGDDVLQEVAMRLNKLARKSDTVARLGGDEFGVILDCGSEENASNAAAALAGRIATSIQEPIVVAGQLVEVGAAIGIALSPTDAIEPQKLLRAADMAMYRAKKSGRGSYCFFNHEMEIALRARVAMEDDVRHAVAQRAILPFYQPLVNLVENRLIGFEVLARWHHPKRGAVEPATFIPVVEKLGLIGEFTYDLLRRACADARAWPSDLTIALNISPLHFADPLLPVKVLAILSESDFPPTRLELEITETALIADVEAARTALTALQAIGIKISLDDFGTGYSNLYNLRDLRFDKIKIDRSFVQSMRDNAGSAKIVRSVIDLAKSLGLPTIAEGIEHGESMQEIVASGGELGQGFYFGRAMPAAEATELVYAAKRKGGRKSQSGRRNG